MTKEEIVRELMTEMLEIAVVPRSTILTLAMADGIGSGTVDRVKRVLGVVTRKSNRTGEVFWTLPL